MLGNLVVNGTGSFNGGAYVSPTSQLTASFINLVGDASDNCTLNLNADNGTVIRFEGASGGFIYAESLDITTTGLLKLNGNAPNGTISLLTNNGNVFIDLGIANIDMSCANTNGTFTTNALNTNLISFGSATMTTGSSGSLSLGGAYTANSTIKINSSGASAAATIGLSSTGGYGLGDITTLTTNNKILLRSALNTANSQISLQSGSSSLAVGATTGIRLQSATGSVVVVPADNDFVKPGFRGASSATSGWLCVGPGSTQLTPASPLIGTIMVGTDGLVYIWAGLTPAWQRLTTTTNDPPVPV